MAKETEIGKRLKDLIRNSGKTQGDFAAECNVSKDTLTSHFKSENMSVDYLKKYALALGVSTDYLIFGEKKKKDGFEEFEELEENQIPLCEINKGIALLIKLFGSDIAKIQTTKYGEKYIDITVHNTRLAENVLKIKKLLELIQDDDGSIKEELEKGLETVVNAEDMIVEITPGGTFVYNAVKEIIYWDNGKEEFVLGTNKQYDEYLNNYYKGLGDDGFEVYEGDIRKKRKVIEHRLPESIDEIPF